MEIVIAFIGALIFLAHFFAEIFKRWKIPDVLPLMLLGVLVGPVLGWITPQDLGQVGEVFTIIVLIIVLFESGITLNLKTLKTTMASSLRLTIISFISVFAVVGIMASLFSSLSLIEGFILAAILGGTSSVVVAPIVERLNFGQETQTRLIVESTLSDTLCIIATLGLVNYFLSQNFSWTLLGFELVITFLFPIILGVIAGIFWSFILKGVRHIENNIFATPAFVFIVFGLVEFVDLSGALAALAFGVALGNIHGFHLTETFHLLRKSRPLSLNRTEKNFLEEVVFLLKTFFFTYIGLSITIGNEFVIIASIVVVLLMLILRIGAVFVSWSGENITAIEASLAAVMIPKGLAAAALASLPLAQGIPGGELIQSVTYMVILFSVLVTAFLAFLLEGGWIMEPYRTAFQKFAPISPTPPEEEK